jgi:ABC-type amino acid transport substrate-binding protein
MLRRRWRRCPACRFATAISAIAIVTVVATATAQAPHALGATLDRVRNGSRLRRGYPADARPFAYRDASGVAAGYSVALCQRLADAVKNDLQLSELAVEWVAVDRAERFHAVQEGAIDVLCGADTVTLDRRRDVGFSLPIFPGGIGAVLRTDAPARLRQALDGRGPSIRPMWRGAAAPMFQARAFSAVAGTTAEKWLTGTIEDLRISTVATATPSVDAGLQALRDRRVDAFFGERAILLDSARQRPDRDLVVLSRLFTYEPLALTLGRDDERFRLIVDRTLSQFYATGELTALYAKWFGEPDEGAATFFKWSMLSP